MLNIETLVVGPLQTNCYLAWCDKTKQSIIVDPGDDGEYIIQQIIKFKIKPLMIVATHGHFDHVCASLEIKLAFNIPFFLPQNDGFLLSRAQNSAKHWTGFDMDPPAQADRYLVETQSTKFKIQNKMMADKKSKNHPPKHRKRGLTSFPIF